MSDLIWRLVAPFFLLHSAEATWPFQPKRFTSESLVDAGPLGLEAVKGRVVALGDWNGDSNTDLFVLSEDEKSVSIYTWDRTSWKYHLTPHSITLSSRIQNVIPADWNHDGRLDLLLMYEEDGGWASDKKIGMRVYLQNAAGELADSEWDIPSSKDAQGIVYDAEGSLRPSLLGFAPGGSGGSVQSWTNSGTGLSMRSPPLQDPSQICSLASPHSSAFVDISGDCLPDLVLHCTTPRTSQHSLQIWVNTGASGYTLSRSYDLPKGSGPISFGDINRDGTLDIVFPVCSRHTTSSGVGSDCTINIAYNQQIPLCSTEGSQRGADGKLRCRGWGELCSVDPDFAFSFDEGSPYFASIPLSDLLPTTANLLLHPPNQPLIPLPIRIGDFNLDGFPDLLITIHNNTAKPSGGVLSSHAGTQVRVLENVGCKKGVVGCGVNGKGERGFRMAGGKGWEALDGIWDAEGASWVDLDDDGSLDIMVQRSGAQQEGRVSFIQNNFYHDAFFLKAQVLNGACNDGDCEPLDGGAKYSGTGVGYSGGSFKFTVLDTLGRRGAQQVPQLPQTSYHSLHPPYAFIGLGRTNNYVERLSVGTSLLPPLHFTDLESIIPNSQILVNPPSSNVSYAPIVRIPNAEWKSTLFLHPGDWIPYVAAAVFGLVIILGGVVVGLNEREKKEDEKERRRALHAINFQAL